MNLYGLGMQIFQPSPSSENMNLIFDLLLLGSIKGITDLADRINKKNRQGTANMECLAFDSMAHKQRNFKCDDPDMSSGDTFDDGGPNW
jgi:hypothetical protein